MNNSLYKQPEMEFNLKDYIWDLLGQWKAVILVALVSMILVTCLKYTKDIRDYNSAVKQEESQKNSHITTEERIEEALADLTDDDRATVEYLIKQDEWIDTEKDYINKSIRLRTNPTSQRTLEMTYHIKVDKSDEAEADVAALIFGYNTQVKRGSVISALGQTIDSEANNKYIAELVSFEDDGGNNHAATENDEAVMSVRVILTDEADADKVKEIISSAIIKCSEDLNKSICSHKIRQLQSSEAYIFNRDAVDTRNNILYSINNLLNNKKNIVSMLGDEAKAALEKVEAIKTEEIKDDNGISTQNSDDIIKDGTIKKPGISKKYALLGLVLGLMAYAFAYLMRVILRGCINCASDAEYYTQERLLGEIYNRAEHKGFEKLLHSQLVEKYRYQKKTNVDSQMNKSTEALLAVCNHKGIKNVTVIDMIGSSSILKELIQKVTAKGLKVNTIKAVDELDEKDFNSINQALFVVSKETSIKEISNIRFLCDSYEVGVIGSVYIGEI